MIVAKLKYNYWRPITAIRNGDQDGNDGNAARRRLAAAAADAQLPGISVRPLHRRRGAGGGAQARRRAAGRRRRCGSPRAATPTWSCRRVPSWDEAGAAGVRLADARRRPLPLLERRGRGDRAQGGAAGRLERAAAAAAASASAKATSFPGFMMPSGSSACLIARSAAMRPGGASRSSSSRFIWPMPCSAEIEPPAAVTRSWTSRVIAGAFASYQSGAARLPARTWKWTLPSPRWPKPLAMHAGEGALDLAPRPRP